MNEDNLWFYDSYAEQYVWKAPRPFYIEKREDGKYKVKYGGMTYETYDTLEDAKKAGQNLYAVLVSERIGSSHVVLTWEEFNELRRELSNYRFDGYRRGGLIQ